MDYIDIIDMEKINEIPSDVRSNESWISTAHNIRAALGGIGFVYLKNHGINTSVITKAFSEMQKFFCKPQEIKLKYKKGSFEGDFHAFTGYTEPGQELLHPNSLRELRESYDFMQGIGIYPDSEVPDYCASFNELNKHCKELAKKVLILFAISLNLDDADFFLNCCTHVDDQSLPRAGNIRALHYPPIPRDMDIPTGTVRLGEHTDYALLTFLFQDMIGGLEVQTVDGKWIPATPIPDTILVNTGDLLEFWSSGIFPATKHRVMIPENETQKYTDRYSIAYFLGPNVDTIVSCLNVKKTETEEKRLAVNSRLNYYEMEPVIAMEYIMGRLVNSYAKS